MNISKTLMSGVAAVLRQLRRQVTLAVLALAVSPPVTASASAADATALVRAEAQRQGVPVSFALHMAQIESGLRCFVHNKFTSASGPLQIMRGSARAMGYKGDIRHASCAQQTHYGMKHLAMCYKGASGNQALAKRCHQGGVSVLKKRKRKT